MKLKNLIILALLFSSFAYAGDEEDKRKRRRSEGKKIGLHFNSLSLLTDDWSLAAEFVLNGESTFFLTYGTQSTTFSNEVEPDNWPFTNNPFFYNDDVSLSGYFLAASYRYYFNPDRGGNDRYFIEPYAKYLNRETEDRAVIGYIPFFLPDGTQFGQYFDFEQRAIALGTMLGRSWTFGSGFVIDVSAGAGYLVQNEITFGHDFEPRPQNASNYDFSNFDLRFNLSIGYRFPI